jgi:histone acetyltransferase MYST2
MIISMGKKSPKGGYQTNEQRNYQVKIKEMRGKFKGPLADGNESDSRGETQGIDKTRQPTLIGLTSDYDLKLFLEAQAAASEKIVKNS